MQNYIIESNDKTKEWADENIVLDICFYTLLLSGARPYAKLFVGAVTKLSSLLRG